MTFRDRRQRVQTRMRRVPPLTIGAHGLQVGLEPSGADVVRVADLTADHGRLSANFTLFGHLLFVLDAARDIAPEDKRQV